MSEADEFLSTMASSLRKRAAEARAMAEKLSDPEEKRIMLDAAEGCENLASQLENEG
jgi:hypothetical protein